MRLFNKKNLLHLIYGIIIAAVAFYISLAAGTWNGYPMGTDAYAHMFKVKFLLDNWPHIDWNNLWAAGMPMFLWYSIVPYVLLALGKIILGSYELSMQIISVGSIALMGWFIYLISYEVTKNRTGALIAAIVGLITPALWSKLAMGEVPRLIGTAFMPIAWYALIKNMMLPKVSRKWQFLAIIALALAFSGHYIITGATLITVLILLFFIEKDRDSLIRHLQVIVAPGLILSMFTWLPFVISSGMRQVFGEGLFGGNTNQALTNLSYFFYYPEQLTSYRQWVVDYGAGLYPLLLPLAMILLVLAIGYREKFNKVKKEWLVIKAFAFISFLFVFYAVAMYFGFPGKYYNAALPPADGFYFLAMTLPILIGLCWPIAFRSRWLQIFCFVGLLTASGFFIQSIYPMQNLDIKTSEQYRFYDRDQSLGEEMNNALVNAKQETNYRFADNNSFIATWFNYDFNIPQTRDYYSQALLNGNDKFWFENAVFALNGNYQETKFLLDWWGVKWLTVQFPNFNFDKFNAKPEIFKKIADNNKEVLQEKLQVFEYLDPKPIIQATNAKTVLVIGDTSSYRNLMMSLARTQLTSEKLIPIQGKQMVDLYSLEDLQKFDAVYLYNFTYMEKERAFDLLDKYVYNGGKLMIDSSAVLSNEGGTIAFLPAPIKKIQPGNFGLEWQFEHNDNEIFKDVETNNFGQAVYSQSQPWSMLYAKPEDLREGTESLLTNYGNVVIAKMKHGQGVSYWSGLNLIYHANNYKMPAEDKFIENVFIDLTDLNNFTSKTLEGNILNPQDRQIAINDSVYTGVLVKENYYPTWRAYTRKNNQNQSQEIYSAGPGMMYIRLPKNSENIESYTVNLTYGKWWYEWLALGISGLYLLWLLYSYLIHRGPNLEVQKKENEILANTVAVKKMVVKNVAKKVIKKKNIKQKQNKNKNKNGNNKKKK